MPPRSVLLLRATLSPMLLKATPYYEDRSLSRLANTPSLVSHRRPEPSAVAPEPPRVRDQCELASEDRDPGVPTISAGATIVEAKRAKSEKYYLD